MDVFTTVTASYDHAAELAMALDMLKQRLPEKSRLKVIERSQEDPFAILTEAVRKQTHKADDSDLCLIIKEPALLLGRNTVAVLKHALDHNSQFDCVLPEDIRSRPQQPGHNYMTLRKFNHYAAALQNSDLEIKAYDGREPFLFMFRSRAIEKLDRHETLRQLPGLLGQRSAIVPQAYAHPFFDYYDENRDDVLPLIPDGVESILDIGCSRGRFGQALKSKRDCRVVGIEINDHEGQHARHHLDRVIIGNVMEVDTDERFDLVTCLDTLEHFSNPQKLLLRIHNEFLKDDGYLIVAIPNVGHWSIVEDLLAGRWDYVPIGILCNTHMRFFTLHSIQALLIQNGFVPLKTKSCPVPMAQDFESAITRMAVLGMEIDQENLNSIGHILLTRKVEVDRKTINCR